jgi:hypothetical protein
VARKGWESLSDSYRERLERGGIDRAAYSRGESLSSARGHAATPERQFTAKELETPPERFRGYAELRREIITLKRELLSESGKREYPKWIENQLRELKGKSRAALEKGRDILDARVNQNMTWDELREMFPELDSDDWDWVGHYH